MKKPCFSLFIFFACEFIHVLECAIDPASVPTQYIFPIAYCLYIFCIYCLLLVACTSVPVAAWLPDFVPSVATPCGVFCAPYPVVARRFSPRVQQARNSYSRPVRRSQKNDGENLMVITFDGEKIVDGENLVVKKKTWYFSSVFTMLISHHPNLTIKNDTFRFFHLLANHWWKFPPPLVENAVG